MNEKIKEGGNRLKEFFGEEPKERITIYVTTTSTAKSNMSGVYSAYVIINNEPRTLVYNERVCGCGLDRTFELAYNIFTSAYGYNNPKTRYQEFLRKENI